MGNFLIISNNFVILVNGGPTDNFKNTINLSYTKVVIWHCQNVASWLRIHNGSSVCICAISIWWSQSQVNAKLTQNLHTCTALSTYILSTYNISPMQLQDIGIMAIFIMITLTRLFAELYIRPHKVATKLSVSDSANIQKLTGFLF